MSITPVNFRASQTTTKTNNSNNEIKKPQNTSKAAFKKLGISEPPPLVFGLGSAAIWTGVGMLMDKGMSKLFKYKYDPKLSFRMNAIVGLVVGTIDYFRARKN